MPNDVSSQSSRWYVYAILSGDATLPQPLTGIGDAPVTLVLSGAIAAAVSPFIGASAEPSPAQLVRHEATVEAIRRGAPTLPVRFGTLFPDLASVARSLEARASTLQADLARVGDKLEMGLALLWATREPGETPSQPHTAGDGSVAALPESLRAPSGPGVQYLASRFAHYASESRSVEDARRLAQRVDVILRPYVLESRYTLRPAPRLALRSAHLLQPNGELGFRRVSEELRMGAPDLHVLVTGPWPPYSFAMSPAQSRNAHEPAISLISEASRRNVDA